MDLPARSFDVIWSEGAIYNLGFEIGLNEFRKFVKPGGYIAVSEVVWLKTDPPAELFEFWQQYPQIDSVEAKIGVIQRNGFDLVGHFVFPACAWSDEYYEPMQDRIPEKAIEWQGISEAEAVLEEARHEISMFRRYQDYFSYAFFIITC